MESFIDNRSLEDTAELTEDEDDFFSVHAAWRSNREETEKNSSTEDEEDRSVVARTIKKIAVIQSDVEDEDSNISDVSSHMSLHSIYSGINTSIAEAVAEIDQTIEEAQNPTNERISDSFERIEKSNPRVSNLQVNKTDFSGNVLLASHSAEIDQTIEETQNPTNERISDSFERIEKINPRASDFQVNKIVFNSTALPASLSDEDVISVSSDEELLPITKTPATASKQATLPQFFPKKELFVLSPISANISENSNASSSSLNVSDVEYKMQKQKLDSLQTDLMKAKNILRTANLNMLPDKGRLLIEKHNFLIKSVEAEEEIYNKMVIDRVEKNEIIQAAPPTWNILREVAGAVQPKTFGKQAIATLNVQKALTMDRLEQLHGSLESCPTEDTYAVDPPGLKVELMAHQKRALAWLVWREKQKPSGGILADDMGLGKTLTMISLTLMSILAEQDESDADSDSENTPKRKKSKLSGGTLVICPASLINQWEAEVHKRLERGNLSIDLYHGPKRETSAKRLARYDMVITTYAIASIECDKNKPLYRIKWRRIVLDEAHQVRNHKSKTSVAMCELAAKSRWALTGTPIHNKELDLYSLLKFLRCSPFDDLAVWKRWIKNKSTGGQERLNTVISSLLLRRTKAQLMEKGTLTSLPERTWELIEVRLDKAETDVYQRILIFSRTLFAQFLHQRAEKDTDQAVQYESTSNAPNENYFKMHKKLVKLARVKEVKQHEILVLLLRLRQICCHPSLITGMLDGDNNFDEGDDEKEEMNILDQLSKLNIDDHNETVAEAEEEGVGLREASRGLLNPSSPIFAVDRRSTKIKTVLKILKEKVLENGDKCIIVSQWVGLLNLVAIALKEERITYEQLDGTVPVHKRMQIVDTINDPASTVSVLLLSLTAGGVGLNLVGANHLLLLDLHWNPQLEMQAQDRIYRMGQRKPVYVYKFMTVDTIEQRIKALQDGKLDIANAMLMGAKIQETKLSLADLKMLFNM